MPADPQDEVTGELTEAARIETKDQFARWQDCLDSLRALVGADLRRGAAQIRPVGG